MWCERRQPSFDAGAAGRRNLQSVGVAAAMRISVPWTLKLSAGDASWSLTAIPMTARPAMLPP